MDYASFKLFPELNIYVLSFYRPVGLEDIFKVLDRVIRNMDYQGKMNVIADFRKSWYIFSKEDVTNYVNFYKENGILANKRKCSMITRSSERTTYSLLFKSISEGLPLDTRVFSSLDEGLEWVDVPLEKHQSIQNYLIEAEISNARAAASRDMG